ncbi:MAG: hypothetical protein M1356_01050, partial [Gammaproteobacteria bacterium]|nr:hypothetical protein [Gammaproteobacteria bacterium]
MSTLYGADAIGGVINIITRSNLDSWHGSVTLGATLQEDGQYGGMKSHAEATTQSLDNDHYRYLEHCRERPSNTNDDLCD